MQLQHQSKSGSWPALLFFLLLFVPATAVAGRLVVYPFAQGAPANDDFMVRVRLAGEGAWQAVPTYAWNVDHVVGTRHQTEVSSVASFDFEGRVEVAVVRQRRQSSTSDGSASAAVTRWRVRPLSYEAPLRQRGDTLFFELDRPRNLSVEADGDIYHNLQLFANAADIPVCRSAAEVAKAYGVRRRDVVFFGPGYHVLSDSLRVGSGQTVYLSGGAYVKGWMSVWQANGVRVVGHGMLNPERQHEGLMIRYSRNVTVNGLLTTQIPVGGSDSVHIENAKVISWYGWGDGMNVFASNNVSYRHVFCRTSDDCSTIYCTRKGYHGGCCNISIDDAVYWADVAHPIMIGLHGDIDRNEVIEQVTYSNVDILQQNERQVDYQGCIGINNGDNILVRNITFRNIRIEDIECGMLFNFRVCFNRKYCQAPGRGIQDILLENIHYNGTKANTSLIVGYDDGRGISNITFRNLVINGQVIHDDMSGKPKWYKTSDLANMFVGEHVMGMRFEP